MKSIFQQPIFVLVLISSALAILTASVIFTHNIYTIRFPGGNDSIPHYLGTQAWLFESLSPYSNEVTKRAQNMVYGRLALPGEDGFRFVYPFYTIFFYIPLAFFTWDWAQAIGIVVLILAILLITIFSMSLYKWSPPPLILIFTFLWTVTWYHAVRTIILVQFAGIAALLIVIGLWAIKNEHDVLGGVMIALATAKPQMLFLLLPLIGIWGILNKKWRLTLTLGFTLVALFGISFLFLPTWVIEMRAQIVQYIQYTHIGSPLNILTTIVFPSPGSNTEKLLISMLLIWLLWEWWQVRFDLKSKRLDWVIALTLIVTNLVITRTATTNYMMMLPALFFIFKTSTDRFGVKADLWIVITQVVLAIGIWVLFAFTVEGNAEQWPVYLPFPLGLLAAMLLFKPQRELQTTITTRHRSQLPEK